MILTIAAAVAAECLGVSASHQPLSVTIGHWAQDGGPIKSQAGPVQVGYVGGSGAGGAKDQQDGVQELTSGEILHLRHFGWAQLM